jgi:cytoskeleton-associated protein 5
LTDPLAVLMEDGFEGARNEAANCLGTLMKMVGERPLNALMDSLADVRKVKVKEAAEKATVKSKAGGGAKPPASKPAAAPAKKPAAPEKKPEVPSAPAPAPAEELLMEDEPPKKLGKPPARLLVSFFTSQSPLNVDF